jgi:hypothetical protein
MRKSFKVAGLVIGFSLTAPLAWAEARHPVYLGETSGPAAGKPVEPSGSIQKDNTDIDPAAPPNPSSASAGAPAVEGKQGTQSGK